MIKEKRDHYVPKMDEVENIIRELDERLIGINNEILGPEYGKRLGQHIISKSNRAGYKNPSEWLLNLPVYFIISHSSLDVNMNITKDGLKLRDGYHSEYSLTEFENRIIDDEFKFIISPTPPSTWGLLGNSEIDISHKDHEHNHVLGLKKREIVKCLFNNNPAKRIKNIPHKVDEDGDPIEAEDIKSEAGGYFLPATFVPQKNQEFHGTTLSGGGFGLIKITGNNSVTSRIRGKTGKITSIKKRIEEALKNKSKLRKTEEWKENGWDKDRVSSEKYFIIDQGWNNASKKDKELHSLLKRHNNLYMEDIVETGEEGIYITLSCSTLNMGIVDEKTGKSDYVYVSPDILEEDKIGNWVKLRTQLINKYDDVFDYHKKLWDDMTGILGWQVKEDLNCYTNAQYIDDGEDLNYDEYKQGRDIILKANIGVATRSVREFSKVIGDDIISQFKLPRQTPLGLGLKTKKKKIKNKRKSKKRHRKSKRK